MVLSERYLIIWLCNTMDYMPILREVFFYEAESA